MQERPVLLPDEPTALHYESVVLVHALCSDFSCISKTCSPLARGIAHLMNDEHMISPIGATQIDPCVTLQENHLPLVAHANLPFQGKSLRELFWLSWKYIIEIKAVSMLPLRTSCAVPHQSLRSGDQQKTKHAAAAVQSLSTSWVAQDTGSNGKAAHVCGIEPNVGEALWEEQGGASLLACFLLQHQQTPCQHCQLIAELPNALQAF